jgi:hypothetical protein
MQSGDASPLCPKCGKAPKKIGERIAGAMGSTASGSIEPPERFDVYRCSCGTSFTHSLKEDNEASEQS